MAGDPAHPGGSTEGHPAAGAGPAPPQPQASSASKGLKGVSLRFLSDFAAKLPADMTTGQIVSKYITPKCQGQASERPQPASLWQQGHAHHQH